MYMTVICFFGGVTAQPSTFLNSIPPKSKKQKVGLHWGSDAWEQKEITGTMQIRLANKTDGKFWSHKKLYSGLSRDALSMAKRSTLLNTRLLGEVPVLIKKHIFGCKHE